MSVASAVETTRPALGVTEFQTVSKCTMNVASARVRESLQALAIALVKPRIALAFVAAPH
jgi:hypothetical protein